jgi:hypothetical protein
MDQKVLNFLFFNQRQFITIILAEDLSNYVLMDLFFLAEFKSSSLDTFRPNWPGLSFIDFLFKSKVKITKPLRNLKSGVLQNSDDFFGVFIVLFTQ